MEITFETLITIGRVNPVQDTFSFTLDYDLEKDDLDEYAKEIGYKDGLDLLKSEMLETFDEDDEEIAMLEEEYNNHIHTCECEMSKSTLKDFERFMKEKYAEKFEGWLLGVLTHNSERTLNELKTYNFND